MDEVSVGGKNLPTVPHCNSAHQHVYRRSCNSGTAALIARTSGFLVILSFNRYVWEIS
jgi:hypothetical protein